MGVGEPLFHHPDLSGIWLKPPMSHHKSQETILSEVEFTFLWVYEQYFLQESLKYQLHLLNVFVLGSGEEQYIIKVDEKKGFNVSQNMSLIMA